MFTLEDYAYSCHVYLENKNGYRVQYRPHYVKRKGEDCNLPTLTVVNRTNYFGIEILSQMDMVKRDVKYWRDFENKEIIDSDVTLMHSPYSNDAISLCIDEINKNYYKITDIVSRRWGYNREMSRIMLPYLNVIFIRVQLRHLGIDDTELQIDRYVPFNTYCFFRVLSLDAEDLNEITSANFKIDFDKESNLEQIKKDLVSAIIKVKPCVYTIYKMNTLYPTFQGVPISHDITKKYDPHLIRDIIALKFKEEFGASMRNQYASIELYVKFNELIDNWDDDERYDEKFRKGYNVGCFDTQELIDSALSNYLSIPYMGRELMHEFLHLSDEEMIFAIVGVVCRTSGYRAAESVVLGNVAHCAGKRCRIQMPYYYD